MTPLTGDELLILIKARDVLQGKVTSGNRASTYRVDHAYSALIDLLRHSVLDTEDEAAR